MLFLKIQNFSNIENIIIEGHTDSDGSYIYNLDLSQKRAYEVMNFIYTFYKSDKLQKLLMASGRSFSDPVFVNGVEDKDKSRRIEIKFSIKNDNALKDVEKFLNFIKTISPIQKINFNGFEFYIKRDDLLGEINGNKARKLAF